MTKYDPSLDALLGKDNGREISIGIETSANFPHPDVIQKDIDHLSASVVKRRQRIKEIRGQIETQHNEKEELLKLVEDPGIYDAEACGNAALRCDDHIRMYEALIKKEKAGIEQFEGMIETLEKNKCLSEMMSE